MTDTQTVKPEMEISEETKAILANAGPQSVIVEQALPSESAAIIQVIERAAMNPQVDIDKMERLLEMQERIMGRNAQSEYAAAFADMQPELPPIPERGKGHGSITYALWEDTNDLIKPVLAKHGFGLSFKTGQVDANLSVTAILTHRAGHSEETTMVLAADNTGSKNGVQAIGSSTQYGKRYTAAAILNLTSRGEDDDGNAAGNGEPVSADQLRVLFDKIEETYADTERFCVYLNVPDLKSLPARRFDEAMEALKTHAPKPKETARA